MIARPRPVKKRRRDIYPDQVNGHIRDQDYFLPVPAFAFPGDGEGFL